MKLWLCTAWACLLVSGCGSNPRSPLAPANDPPLAEMQTFYQTWLKYNGAFVGLIRSNHAQFLGWVNQ